MPFVLEVGVRFKVSNRVFEDAKTAAKFMVEELNAETSATRAVNGSRELRDEFMAAGFAFETSRAAWRSKEDRRAAHREWCAFCEKWKGK